jgi:hypothetical protein
MFTVRIDWNSKQPTLHSVYSCDHYLVSEEFTEEKGTCLALYLDDTKHHIKLTDHAVAFVMNANGKTVDTIRIPSNWVTP